MEDINKNSNDTDNKEDIKIINDNDGKNNNINPRRCNFEGFVIIEKNFEVKNIKELEWDNNGIDLIYVHQILDENNIEEQEECHHHFHAINVVIEYSKK